MAVVDLKVPDKSGIEVLGKIKELSPETRTIMLAGYGSIANAVDAVKHGAINYLSKPVVWATDRKAYGRLSRLFTEGRRCAPKGECFLSFEDLANHHERMIGGIDPRFSLQTESKIEPSGLSPISQVKNLQPVTASVTAAHSLASFIEYKDVFDDRCYILAELNKEVDDHEKLYNLLLRLSNLTHIPLVAAGDVHYHEPNRLPLHDVLTAIKH